MRDSSELNYLELIKAGGITGLISFTFKCVPDLFFTKKMLDTTQNASPRKTKGFWQNSKGALYWDFKYRMLMGFMTLPLQHTVEHTLIQQYGKNELSNYQKAMIGSFAGWLAAMVEINIVHSLDSMRATVLNNPAVFNNHGGIPYFLTHQSQLRAGIGFGMLRNSVSNPPAWCAKTMTKTYLAEHTEFDKNIRNILTAIIFVFVRFVAGYPFDVIKTAMQCDAAQQQFQHRHCREKIYYAMNLINRQIKNRGFFRFFTTGFFMRLPANISSAAIQVAVFDHLTNASSRRSC